MTTQTQTTYTPDGLLARFRAWTAPELPTERERVRAELAALREAKRMPTERPNRPLRREAA